MSKPTSQSFKQTFDVSDSYKKLTSFGASAGSNRKATSSLSRSTPYWIPRAEKTREVMTTAKKAADEAFSILRMHESSGNSLEKDPYRAQKQVVVTCDLNRLAVPPTLKKKSVNISHPSRVVKLADTVAKRRTGNFVKLTNSVTTFSTQSDPQDPDEALQPATVPLTLSPQNCIPAGSMTTIPPVHPFVVIHTHQKPFSQEDRVRFVTPVCLQPEPFYTGETLFHTPLQPEQWTSNSCNQKASSTKNAKTTENRVSATKSANASVTQKPTQIIHSSPFESSPISISQWKPQVTVLPSISDSAEKPISQQAQIIPPTVEMEVDEESILGLLKSAPILTSASLQHDAVLEKPADEVPDLSIYPKKIKFQWPFIIERNDVLVLENSSEYPIHYLAKTSTPKRIVPCKNEKGFLLPGETAYVEIKHFAFVMEEQEDTENDRIIIEWAKMKEHEKEKGRIEISVIYKKRKENA